ncbi:hypothetical protein Dsin_004181 [Dipteronia sinensis]|uniref:Uncharacterized protein n=1 Tax=Dipteronia sinensis TaxID=43782 RepID=A0AAE0EMU6_9ROSI|nr:hypothetical protein Dsin_004181 [Dipteronia sinensis]
MTNACIWYSCAQQQSQLFFCGFLLLSPLFMTGLKPFARMSSNYSAGVPFKKRRYPIIRPPSPTAENELLAQW